MNIGIISSTSSFHHLAQLFLKNKNNKVYHYGANKDIKSSNRYFPTPVEIPINKQAETILEIIDQANQDSVDFIIASGIPLAVNRGVHSKLNDLKIPYFFVSPEMASLETNKGLSKKMLLHLGIPTGNAKEMTGAELFRDFKQIPRPFVVKLNTYQYGKQTVIVNDHNYDDVFYDLFSVRLNDYARPSNIRLDTTLLIEDVIKIKKEYSYHMLVNESGWEYLGSARDYKRIYDKDQGFNSVSMGAYNTEDIDPVVHEYADKIVNFLKTKGVYRGFMFLGIAVDENDIPYVLEINTRAGDPELQAILGSVTNDLAELFYSASTGIKIPKVVHNKKKTVTVRLVNRVYDWSTPASFLPKLSKVPSGIIQGIEGTDKFFIKHSVYTASDKTHELASQKIYDYLDQQFVGQYRYRRDIGFLK